MTVSSISSRTYLLLFSKENIYERPLIIIIIIMKIIYIAPNPLKALGALQNQ